jgi:ketosteroid isomerase-like protein
MSKFATPEDLLKSQVEEFNKGNIDFLVTLYENDICLANQPGQVVKDKELIRKTFRDFINKGIKLDARAKRAYYADNLALLITEWSLNSREPDGTPIHHRGNGIIVFRRQYDDTWLMVIENPWGTN